MNYNEFLKQIYYLYAHRHEVAYCLGACGELAESDRVRNLFNWYYENGYSEIIGMTYNEWLKINRGKMCFDCSGLIDYVLFGYGNHNYSSWTFGEMPKNESLSKGVEGSILWKKGHVGVDIGRGYFIDCPNWNKELRFGKISEYDWTSSHSCIKIDYTGASDK